ncbi:hypothetical protein K501DRAFT_320172 [Backusella circina FSU 941]|nr:hypothetical protein K501DRAFT_320172 [Backusella circina FSU 941]
MTGSVTITKGQQHAMNNKAHQVIDISTRVPTKSIRIERNYSLGDGITRFNTEYPIELTGRLSPEQFQYTIDEINKRMDYADRLSWRIVFENIIETLTIYIWPIFFSTHYQRSVKQLLSFIDSENINVYHPQSLSISNPVKSAFLYVSNFYSIKEKKLKITFSSKPLD